MNKFEAKLAKYEETMPTSVMSAMDMAYSDLSYGKITLEDVNCSCEDEYALVAVESAAEEQGFELIYQR